MFGGFKIYAALRVAIVVVFAARIGLAARSAHADPAEAKKIFTQRCMACHTFGKGVKVGPDLKGVTERRQRAWLLKFIRSSATVIDSGDATAVDLFQQFKQQRMPDWTDLSEEQIGSILDWLAVNGPDQQEADARLAELATPAELETGRQLFHGDRALTHGGTACGSCHSIRDRSGSSGGTLASDLTQTYADYQDSALTLFLKHPCTQRIPESTTTFLTPEESFALKAYLRQAALIGQAAGSASPAAGLVAKPVDDPGNAGSPTPGPGSSPGKLAAPVAARRVAWAPKPAGSVLLGTSRGARLTGELMFLALPYAALILLLAGLGVRYAIARRRPDDLRSASSEAWQLFRGQIAWRVGVAVTLALHLLGLLVPRTLVAWNSVPVRLYLLEGGGFLLGAIALIGWGQIMRRHLGRGATGTRATLSELADSVWLSLIGMAIVSGLVTAVLYRWGSSWATGTLSPYIASLARGTPATQLVEGMPFLVRIHVFSWFLVMALVPFTSAALILASGIERCVVLVTRPLDAAIQMARRMATKLSPARWLWPEEDALDLPALPAALPAEASNAQEPS
jgi:nitrate reductase gamma subunit